ncbi:MAG: hypothetical protein WD080_07910, partial [Egibacteraceae bacterium]
MGSPGAVARRGGVDRCGGGLGGTAFDNAHRLIHVEKQLGIFHEAFLQQLILQTGWMVDVFNYVYI